MRLVITQKHIREGNRADSNNCAVALALHELVKDDVIVEVLDWILTLSRFVPGKGSLTNEYEIDAHPDLVEFITTFDDEGTPIEAMAPAVFDLNWEIPEEYLD